MTCLLLSLPLIINTPLPSAQARRVMCLSAGAVESLLALLQGGSGGAVLLPAAACLRYLALAPCADDTMTGEGGTTGCLCVAGSGGYVARQQRGSVRLCSTAVNVELWPNAHSCPTHEVPCVFLSCRKGVRPRCCTHCHSMTMALLLLLLLPLVNCCLHDN